MGVPKFFRWLSERYPPISQLIAENRIPEFDNLYLDMNGIIHNCTHNDSDSVTKARLSEDEMFLKIFNYIEFLFGKIKPQKLFFMAIDGVAPRAKMNQQRSRRFRTALDAEKARDKAIAEGRELPKEDPFDSNCITPGTEFMARLTQQLKYFVAKKVSEDGDWQGCEIVLSGHEVPGEGEHKIMEYIRQAKSQLDYDPNVRHCLYGLDADLIMLGLLSHDPHFCLLREEVTFGRQGKSKSQDLEHQNFFLLHLCIVREYLELEFQELKEKGALGNLPFDMERIIDDFILMAFFVGNDFLPNLPYLHINEGALALMFAVYKKILPKAGGYINDGGTINLERLALLLEELSDVEYRHFEAENQDAGWLKDKSIHKEDVMQKTKKKGVTVMSTNQKELYQKVKRFVNSRPASGVDTPLDMGPDLKAADRAFVDELAHSLRLQSESVINDDGDRAMQLSFPPRPEMDDEDDEEDEEAQNALLRVFKHYDKAKVEDVSASDAQLKAKENLPGIFPDLEHCRVVENIFELPTMDGLEYYIGLMDGVKLGKDALYGFPSLQTLPHTGQLGFHGVAVFQQESRNESMVVTLSEGEEKGTIAHARQRLGKAVHVGYPFLHEGKVTTVTDEMFTYRLADPDQPATEQNIIQVPHPPQGISDWKKKADRIEKHYSKRLGMIIGTIESLVQIDPLVGLEKTDLGATIKQYAPIQGFETDYATQTIVDTVISEDQRFLEKEAVPIQEEFPVGTRAFFLGDMAYGRPLEITGHVKGSGGADKAQTWVSILKGPEQEFGLHIAAQAEARNPYVPSYAVARQLHLHPLVLSKLTSAFTVMSSGLKLNLGLNLKFEAKKQKVLGYSRKSDKGWEYSPKAIDLLKQYMINFPEFIARIEANPTGDGWEDTAFYSDPQVAKAKMKEIGQWLKSVETKAFEKVPLEAEQLDGDTVLAIEQAADANNAVANAVYGKKIGGVPRVALLKPVDAEQRTQRQKFRLGHRVVYVLDTGRVPVAMRGTVVGLTRTSRNTLLDIVFDSTFMSGTTLGGRCSPFRGSTVPSNAVLNLTDRQVVAMSQAAKDRVQQPSFTPLRGAFSSNAGSYGMPGQPQLVNAAIPPPIRGGWNSAARGQTNGAPRANGNRGRGGGLGSTQDQSVPSRPRGRGGMNGNAQGFTPRGGRGGGAPNRGGYTIVDNSDPSQGVVQNNPKFRPQNYSNVPPPADLDAGRGRGRGGGRGGRGGGENGRGRGRGGRGRGEPVAS
ncbi:uncharacterized protein MYCFIDRAFT_215434 [Pseudocercospora fijiensis CIRAD86]|uniref:5'-3' exoribonuclease 1 n=1 Tax=Pseudocercospora fijiensis (strain CIRAD86) TaxID=383855 RepID=M3AX32_PSEFD|nr:uncharacterized protein MYCFIDRAFT_215434 [Pseudocercospora fijiensis CIRAD86]EME81653.1 hypothetical protein MYCFIDRAFT_215434 [Pseudocercospora fijiensis CIRAD86]